jgi:hypothetical protein
MPPQVKRLVPLFAIFIGLFLLARYLLIPDSFGEFGHYRGNSIQENADFTLHYAGKDACAECHDDMAADIASDAHAGISCESCHGPGLDHATYADSIGINKPSGREFCSLCHSVNQARRADVVKQIDLSDHNVDNDCIDCHNSHKPWEIKDL